MSPAMTRGISLANKCLILFGCALAVILVLTLAVPWIKTSRLVREYQLEVASQLADALLHDPIGGMSRELSMAALASSQSGTESDDSIFMVGYLPWSAIERTPTSSNDSLNPTAEQAYAARFREAFTGDDPAPHLVTPESIQGQSVYLYARPVYKAELSGVANTSSSLTGSATLADGPTRPEGLVIVRRSTHFGEDQLSASRILFLITGLVAIVAGMILFRLMLARLVFSPVVRLGTVIEQVTEGNLDARSKLRTGDELEALSGGLDEMLDQLTESQDRLQRMNENLDLKVAELAEANVGLWESTRFKTEFLANISHELRTPLNSIIGFTELLHDKALEEDDSDSRRVRYLSNILNSSRSLLEMINELLDMAKIEAGRMEVNVEPTSLGDVIELLMRAMVPQAEARGITMESDVPDDLPIVETDPGKVQQILYNLLSNAVKFSPDNGTIMIKAENRSSPEDGTADRVVLSVADQGPGIPADLHDVIFEKFRQVDASHTRTHMGTGLGLAICRDLVDMLHGELWLQSADGEGATFFVSLDLAYRNRAPQALMGNT